MRVYLISFFGTVMALLLAPLAIYSQFAGTQVEAGRFVKESLEVKLAAAHRMPHPGIIIVGGSNALFGFNAVELEKELQCPAVNLATHAGLGLDYIRYTAEKVVGRGDVVVLALEYDLYGDEKTTYAKDFQVLAVDPQYLRDMSFFRRWACLLRVSPDNWGKLVAAKFRPEPPIKAGYQVSDFDERGDDIRNDIAQPPERIAHLSSAPAGRFRLSRRAAALLLQFGQDLRQRGARLVVTYPNIIENALDEKLNTGFFEDLKSTLSKGGIDLIGQPRDFAFDKSRLYDTVYHQNSKGQMLSTHKLAELLQSRSLVPR